MWYLFALLSACVSSLRKVGEKQLSHKLNYLTMGWAFQLFSLPVVLIALLLFGEFFNPFELGLRFWLPTLLMSCVVYPVFLYFYVYAIKHGELSKVLPLQSLTPIFALILGRVLINQVPAPLAIVGILLVVTGVYVLNLKGRYLHNPFGVFTGDKPNLCMLISLLLTALAGVLDKIGMQASEPIFYSFVSTIIIVITLLIISTLKGIREFSQVKRYIKPLGISGLLSGVSYTLYAVALNTGPLAYVSTLKSTSVLMGTLIGIVYFKERLTKVKVTSLILITVGTIAIGLGR